MQIFQGVVPPTVENLHPRFCWPISFWRIPAPLETAVDRCFFISLVLSHRIHGTGIFPYMNGRINFMGSM